jgi:GNAT superfamily N-acetyltransferase
MSIEAEKLIIREFIPSDLPVVLDLHRIAMEDIDAYIPGPVNDDLLDIESNYQKNKGTFIIGELNNNIVTMGALRMINDSIAEIKRMRTYPQHQGKGFGSRILHELINYAKLKEYKQIILDTSEKQTAALKLYGKNGFKEYKREMQHGFNCIWLRLDL